MCNPQCQVLRLRWAPVTKLCQLATMHCDWHWKNERFSSHRTLIDSSKTLQRNEFITKPVTRNNDKLLFGLKIRQLVSLVETSVRARLAGNVRQSLRLTTFWALCMMKNCSSYLVLVHVSAVSIRVLLAVLKKKKSTLPVLAMQSNTSTTNSLWQCVAPPISSLLKAKSTGINLSCSHKPASTTITIHLSRILERYTKTQYYIYPLI